MKDVSARARSSKKNKSDAAANAAVIKKKNNLKNYLTILIYIKK